MILQMIVIISYMHTYMYIHIWIFSCMIGLDRNSSTECIYASGVGL